MDSPLRVLLAAPSSRFLGGQAIQAARMLEAFRADGRLDVHFQPHDPSLGPFAFLAKVKGVRTVVREAVYIAQLLWRVPRADVVHTVFASYLSFVIAPTPATLIAQTCRETSIGHYPSAGRLGHLLNFAPT